MSQCYTQLQLREHAAGIYELCLNSENAPVNILNQATLKELEQVIAELESLNACKGLVISSGKKSFVLGADITEFLPIFAQGEKAVKSIGAKAQGLLNRIESLPFPTVCAINGEALGGGFELALSCDFRLGTKQSKVGLPEVKLGIMPGWGGSVRLPRLIGLDTAIELMTSGRTVRADEALKCRAIDGVVAPKQLLSACFEMLKNANNGEFDYLQRREQKSQPISLADVEQWMVFNSASTFIAAKAGPNYPVPLSIIQSVKQQVNLCADAAYNVECDDFSKLASSEHAAILIGNFLNDQSIKRKARSVAKQAQAVDKTAVLGAGIMGGGIAYQSASKGVPIIMKDIANEALKAGVKEASTLLNKQLKRGRLNQQQAMSVLGDIQATLHYGDFSQADLVVEAVVENVSVKKSVLLEIESHVPENTIVASNTSTITIDTLAEDLKRPENFCGMHFFNPVHLMPLVEVIRGSQSSDTAIATTVAYASKMGKMPIVVKDCPGFLVNRVLFPYMHSFNQLLREGVDFQRIDALMLKFGWPMGPAHLIDVVGLDTDHHAAAMMAKAYPDRMAIPASNPIAAIYDANRLGQKNGLGFYRYEMDKRGKPKKLVDDTSYELLKPTIISTDEITDDAIVQRLLLPLCLEAVRCLEEEIVASPAELDMALLTGIGFPAFRGGALKYLDQIGCDTALQWCETWQSLGEAFKPPALLLSMAGDQSKFYPQLVSMEASV